MGLLSRKNEAEAKPVLAKTLTIVNRLGLHARPSAMFVKTAGKFRAEVWVEKDGEKVNGKSIMGLMMLAAGQGTKLHVTAEGSDADKVLVELEEIVARKFDED